MLREVDLSAPERARVAESLAFLDASLRGITRTIVAADMRARDRALLGDEGVA